MLACHWIVLLEYKFVWGVLSIFDRIVRAVTRQVTYEANQLALCILLCHFFFLIRVLYGRAIDKTFKIRL